MDEAKKQKMLVALQEAIPDVAGYTASCNRCGTSVGPFQQVPTGVGVEIRVMCPCGQVLSCFPE